MLTRRNTLLVPKLRLDVIDRIGGLNPECDRNRLAGEDLDERQRRGGESTPFVCCNWESATVFKLLAGEDQVSLIRKGWDESTI